MQITLTPQLNAALNTSLPVFKVTMFSFFACQPQEETSRSAVVMFEDAGIAAVEWDIGRGAES